ncbi:MAG: hypothetical protein J6Q85_02500 [Clostridia bacterium]|nr:hypothetical protein [Clostridia bacterium]
MHIDITYPPKERGGFNRRRLLHILRWPFIALAISCPIVNLAIGGPAWCIIALLVLHVVWTLVFSPDLVEYNRTSQSIKIVAYVCILLTLIDVLLAPGWASFVVPIVCFSGLAIVATLFFTDLETQKHNMLPLIIFIFLSIIGSSLYLSIWHEKDFWPFIVLDSLSVVLIISFAIILGADFKRELKRRFHVK